jgi:lipopolysaccharide transport system permease protein
MNAENSDFATALPPVGDSVLIRIKPSRGWISLNLRELWTYRELLYFLVWRDVKVRYKQTFIGVAWAVLQPLLTMIIFTFVFSRFAKIPSDNLPYPLFAYTALLPWNFFSGALTRSSASIVGQSHLISKVYFPRLVIPLSAVLSGIADFVVAFLLLVVMMVWFGCVPHWGIVALPLFLLLALTTALAAGLWLSALNVRYRDVTYTVPFLIQLWMFASPIAYPSSLVPEQWRAIYSLNPLAGVIEGFRWALIGGVMPDRRLLVISSAVVLVLLVGGLVYFKRMERTFADEV